MYDTILDLLQLSSVYKIEVKVIHRQNLVFDRSSQKASLCFNSSTKSPVSSRMKKGFLKYPDFTDKDLEIIVDINHNSSEMGKMLNDRLKHKILIECWAQSITLFLQFLEHFMVLKKSNKTWVFLQVKCHMARSRSPLPTTKINDGARVSFRCSTGAWHPTVNHPNCRIQILHEFVQSNGRKTTFPHRIEWWAFSNKISSRF